MLYTLFKSYQYGSPPSETATLKNSLAISYQVRYLRIILPSSPSPRYLPKRNLKLCSHINLHTDVSGSFICQHWLETMSLSL